MPPPCGRSSGSSTADGSLPGWPGFRRRSEAAWFRVLPAFSWVEERDCPCSGSRRMPTNAARIAECSRHPRERRTGCPQRTSGDGARSIPDARGPDPRTSRTDLFPGGRSRRSRSRICRARARVVGFAGRNGWPSSAPPTAGSPRGQQDARRLERVRSREEGLRAPSVCRKKGAPPGGVGQVGRGD